MGTRFIVTKECEFNQKVKEAIIEAKEKFPKVTATLVPQGYFACMQRGWWQQRSELRQKKCLGFGLGLNFNPTHTLIARAMLI